MDETIALIGLIIFVGLGLSWVIITLYDEIQKEQKEKRKLKVGCVEYKESFEIEEENISYSRMMDSFKCPICNEDTVLKEPDVFQCYDCDIVWTVKE